MLFAKKCFISFLLLFSLGILQFNMVTGIKLAQADSTLLSTQSLLTSSAANSYGGTPKDAKVIVLKIINTVLSFLAILTVALLLMAGFSYMISGGNEEKIKKSMDQIKALAIGLLIILLSWSITYFLLRTLVCVSTTTGTVCNYL